MPVVDMIATGKNIKNMRKAFGVSVADIQDACGISAAAISKWQKGKAIPSVDNLVILAAIFGVKIDEIVVCKTI